MATQSASARIAAELLAEFAHEVRQLDETDPRAAPQVVMDLCDGEDAQARVLQGILYIL
jgi:hypothetical protein